MTGLDRIRTSLEVALDMCTVDDERDAYFVAVHVGDETRHVAAYPRNGTAEGSREGVAKIIDAARWDGVHLAPLVQPAAPVEDGTRASHYLAKIRELIARLGNDQPG